MRADAAIAAPRAMSVFRSSLRCVAAVRLMLTGTTMLLACQPSSAPQPEHVGPGSADSPASSVQPVATPAPADTAAYLTGRGWGPLHIGMTRDEVVAALGEDANPEAVGGPDPQQCDEFRPKRAPAGMIVMIVEGRLARISLVRGSSVRTPAGLGVGDEAGAVIDAYGDSATVTPHHYVPDPAQYITVWLTGPSGADARGIRYEVGRDGRVTHVHAGGPAIEFVEGCL